MEKIVSLQLSETLLLTPLFQGLSKSDLHEIVGMVHFGFFKISEGKTVMKHDHPAASLIVLLSGSMEVTTSTADSQLLTTETVKAPHLLEPDRLFGMHQYYISDYRAVEQCSFLEISKQEIIALTERYNIFRINMINLFSNNLQRTYLQTWQAPHTELPDRLLRLLLSHCRFPQGEKTFHVKMTTLASWLGCSRLAVSNALKKMQEEGKVLLSRNEIRLTLNP